MSVPREKLASHLGELIHEGEPLAGGSSHSAEVDLWKVRCDRALRLVSDREANEFRVPKEEMRIASEIYSNGRGPEEDQAYWRAILPFKLNVLRAVKEQLELFDEEEQDYLDTVKRFWELKANVGVLQGKIGGEKAGRRR